MNTPKIRFKGFKDDWEQRKFEDVGTVAMCKRIFKEQTSEEGEVPFYKIGTFGGMPDAYITRELFEEYKKNYQYPNKGDILISASGSIGRTVEYTGKDEYYQDSNIVWLKHENDLDNSFLKVLYGVIEWSCEGSTIKRLYNDNFLKTEFMLPKIEEQIKIGEYFSKLDHLITLHQRKCDETKELKKFMLQKLFPKNGQKNPEIRFEGFTDDWEQRKLGDISQITAGGTPSTKELTYWEPKEVPWLASGEVHKKYIYDTDEMISEEGLNNSSAKWVEEGSVLIALAGQGKTRGTAAITRIPITTNQSIAAIKFNDILDADYAFHNLDSRYDELRNISSGDGTRGGLNKQLLADLTIAFPQIYEQREIGEYFTALDNLITLHQRKCEKLKELKKFMLQNMFV